ncbi:MAG: glycosyltransferase family 2 protein [Acidimicrobiales bacterium]
MTTNDAIGIVVIGRNEGERLRSCLESVGGQVRAAVYVDSGSTDGSVELASDHGWEVVELDPATPFTAGRARNEGFEHLIAGDPGIAAVQFLDGDCELIEGWIPTAAQALCANPDTAVVAGVLKERYPEASVYNRLCGIEWDQPTGETLEVGGVFVARSDAFKEVGGFNPVLIAGEEPELCYRLRGAGWKIRRLSDAMAWHDSAMYRFGQWWKRSVRHGHTCAEGVLLHGQESERYKVRQLVSNFALGLGLPLVALGGARFSRGKSLVLLALPVVIFGRATKIIADRDVDQRDAAIYAAFLVLGKVPNALGQLRCFALTLTGREKRIIEYK